MDEFQIELVSDQLSSNVSALIQCLWKEAVGELEEILAVGVEDIKHDDIATAEGILLQLKHCFAKKKMENIADLSQQFYALIPHKHSDHAIDSIQYISQKQDLCQLIRDMIGVSEVTNWKIKTSVEAKYKALNCHIQGLDQSSGEFKSIKNYILSSLTKYVQIKFSIVIFK